MIAASNIEHDGKVINAGNTIKKGDFSDEQLESLKAAGAVVDNVSDLSAEDREAKIANLQAQLAELQSESTEAPSPGKAAEDLQKQNAKEAAKTENK